MSIEISGTDVAVLQPLALTEKLRKTVEQQAIGEANQIVAAAMRSNAPAESGALKRSITSAVRRYKNGCIVLGIAGPDYNFTGNIVTNKKGKKTFKKKDRRRQTAADASGRFRRPAKYAHLVEKGTVQHQTKSGQNRGSVPANPFVQQTARQTEHLVKMIFENAVKAAMK